MTPVFDSQTWTQRMLALPAGTGDVLAFYEHRIGGICKDARLMLAPLDDHLVHRGDGAFESLHYHEGRIFQLDAHLSRLKNSAAAIGLNPPCHWEELRNIVLDVARAGGEMAGSIRILLGRGQGGFGVSPKECPHSSLYIIATKDHPLPESWWERGLTACKSRIPAKQEYLAQIKSTNYLPNVLMAKEAEDKGVGIALSFDEDGFLAEAAVANVAVVDTQGRLLLPTFRRTLPGTTAILAMELAKQSMEVILTDITEETINNASELLVLGTTVWCVAVTHFEGRPVGTGCPGPVSFKLRDLLRAAADTEGTPIWEA